jgi:hypothetical protein
MGAACADGAGAIRASRASTWTASQGTVRPQADNCCAKSRGGYPIGIW